MSLDYAGLTQAVRDLSPTQISVSMAQAAVNRAYQSILRARPGGGAWFGQQSIVTFPTVPDNTAGTVTLTFGSTTVVGVSTTFASTDVGKYLAVGARQPIRIAEVTDATHLTLAQAWGEPTLADAPTKIVTLRYTLPSDADRVVRLVGPTWPCVRRNPGLIDAYDPIRQMRGEPLVYCETELRAALSATVMNPTIITGQKQVNAGLNRVFVFFESDVGTSGYRVFVSPSWNTSYLVHGGRTSTFFRVDFGVPAPAGGLIDWEIIIPGTSAGATSLQTALEIELWPVPDAAMTYTLTYRKRVDDLAADADTPIIAAEAVLWAAQAEQCRKLHGRTGDQTWLAQAAVYQGEADKVLDSMLREDRRMRGSHPVVLDVDDAVPVWDTAWIGAMRILNTLSLPSLA